MPKKFQRGWRGRGFGERTRPRVQFPASRRKTLFGETPNTTRGTRMLPGTPRAATTSENLFRYLVCSRLDRLRKEAAVHADIGSCHEAARRVACEKNNRARQFLRFAKPPYRRVVENGDRSRGWRAVFLEKQAPVLNGWEKSGRYGIHAHAVASPLAREKGCQAQGRGFRSRIGDHAR